MNDVHGAWHDDKPQTQVRGGEAGGGKDGDIPVLQIMRRHSIELESLRAVRSDQSMNGNAGREAVEEEV
jgi:hypothetical protein